MNSIRRQLTRELLIAIILLIGGGVAVLYFVAKDAATEQFDDAVRAKALAITTLTRRTADGVKLEFSDRFFTGFDDKKPRDFFVLRDAGGRELARSESLPSGTTLVPRTKRRGIFEHRRKQDPEDAVFWNIMLPTSRPGRALQFTFKPKPAGGHRGENGPTMQLLVASDREDLDETLWELIGICAAWGGLLVLATGFIVPRALRRGLVPLNELGEQTQKIDATSLATRFESESMPVELRPITVRFNELLARLEQSFERERRFSADLAHELRTPLAELRTLTECALKWPEARDPSNDQEVLEIAEHMERLVTHVLALARGEQGQLAIKLEPVALDGFVQGTWKSFASSAAAKELKVSLDLDPVVADADAVFLRSILGNLFDNAVEYTPAGGVLQIVVEESAGVAVIRVANPTAGLKPDDIPKLFDRFWRKEEARSGGKHVGLGLALARTFATTMRWSLTAALDPEQRLVFTLRGPAGKPASNGGSL